MINNNSVVIDVPSDPRNTSLRSIQKVTVQTENGGTKDAQIMVPWKYLFI